MAVRHGCAPWLCVLVVRHGCVSWLCDLAVCPSHALTVVLHGCAPCLRAMALLVMADCVSYLQVL
jgi:hypothetical protein